ncbi:MAG: OadG family protein [Treponema sp.]|jgi:oxaloacetate decarboxylase gamma subunit|nr:OadG family protein [Treponema sp.]
MTIAEMLEQSGVLTLLGMGIVFGFLVIMIITITVVGKLIHALGLDKDVQGTSNTAGAGPARQPVPAQAGNNNAAVTAAITAAVSEYRKTNS